MVTARLLSLTFICTLSASLNFAQNVHQNHRPVATASAANPEQTSTTLASRAFIKVEWQDEKLSLDVDGAPLSEVLQIISKETGIEIEGTEAVKRRPVFAHFVAKPLAPALQELLVQIDHAITEAGAHPASIRLPRVIIFGRPTPETGMTAETQPAPENASAKSDATDDASADQSSENTGSELDPQASTLAATPAPASTENSPAPAENSQSAEQAQQTPDPSPAQSPAQTDSESVQQRQNTDVTNAAAVDPSSEQPENLAAVESATLHQDSQALRNFLQDSNPAVQAAAFDALASHDNYAVQTLLAQINDASQPNRLQALQLLSQSPQVDEQLVMATLINSLSSSDPALSNYAAQALTARNTPEALNALTQLADSSDSSTHSLLLQLAQTPTGVSFLQAALSDPNETVRAAAAALLQQLQAAPPHP